MLLTKVDVGNIAFTEPTVDIKVTTSWRQEDVLLSCVEEVHIELVSASYIFAEQAAELRFIVSNYSRLSNCSTSIVKVKRWFSCSYLFRNDQFSWPYQECTISTEMYNSTIAEEMSLCNSSMWEFILVSRVDFFLQIKGELDFQLKNNISELFPTAEAKQ